VHDAEVTESNIAPRRIGFLLRLSRPLPRPVILDYETRDGTAQSGREFHYRRGRIAFPAGRRWVLLTVRVVGDLRDEEDEYFQVAFSNPRLGRALPGRRRSAPRLELVNGLVTGRILDDDFPPLLSVGDGRASEGHLGESRVAFPLFVQGETERTIHVRATTGSGTAAAGLDYKPLDAPVTVPPGHNAGQTAVVVTVNGDVFSENDETVELTLGEPRHAELGDGRATGVIADDDPFPFR
jgi:hypothetical protein